MGGRYETGGPSPGKPGKGKSGLQNPRNLTKWVGWIEAEDKDLRQARPKELQSTTIARFGQKQE